MNQLPSSNGVRGCPTLVDELTKALDEGRTDAEGLFVWATYERGSNLFTGDAVRLSEQYLEDGGFSSDTRAKFEEERASRIVE
jgi:hypothetical protein